MPHSIQSQLMDWPHAPTHWLFEPGVCMVTAGTYLKGHHLQAEDRRDLVQAGLFQVAAEFGWNLRCLVHQSLPLHRAIRG